MKSMDDLQMYFEKNADLEEKSRLVRSYLDTCSKRKCTEVSDALLRDVEQI